MGYINTIEGKKVNWNGFYPHGGPPTYSYTSDFISNDDDNYVAESTIADVKRNIEIEKNLLTATISNNGMAGTAIAELNRMIDIARSAEQQFLVSHNMGFPGNNWNDLITGINKILGTESSFKRNIQILQQFAKDFERTKQDNSYTPNTKEYQDVTNFFVNNLEDSIYECLKIDVNTPMNEILESAVKKALTKMKDITDTNLDGEIKTRRMQEGEALKAFTELFEVMTEVQSQTFLKDITKLFDLTNYIEKARNSVLEGRMFKQAKDKSKNRTKLYYKGNKGKGKGSIAEIIYSEISRGLHGINNNGISWTTIERSGPHDYKTDRFLATVDVSYERAVETISNNGINYGDSVRARGIASMEELYKQIGDAKGDIVLISDKNYLIDQGFIEGRTIKGKDILGGFGAQSATSVDALAKLFGALHISIFDIDALTNYLANIGSDLIEPQVDTQVLTAISSQIGNFLFDDLSFDQSAIPQNANIIHVFQLSGIYVPLSIILEGVQRGISAAWSEVQADSFVNVRFNSSSDMPGPWSSKASAAEQEAAFTQFRNKKIKNNKIEIHFLRDFAQIIYQYVQI